MPSYVAGQRLYLDSEKSRVLEAGHPDAAYLLVAEGQELDYDVALKYGLVVEEAAAEGSLPQADLADLPGPKAAESEESSEVAE